MHFTLLIYLLRFLKMRYYSVIIFSIFISKVCYAINKYVLNNGESNGQLIYLENCNQKSLYEIIKTKLKLFENFDLYSHDGNILKTCADAENYSNVYIVKSNERFIKPKSVYFVGKGLSAKLYYENNV